VPVARFAANVVRTVATSTMVVTLLAVQRTVPIRGETIRLGQLLKLSGAAGDGVEAKARILAGEVAVNGEPELRRGRQLHDGDRVAVGGEELLIVAGG
jgi:ribosome-associated protein